MNVAAHSIGTFDLRATVGDFDQALALRPRIEALAADLMPALIERICDAAIPGDAFLRIARLDLDLGAIGEAHLEEETLAALERSLGEAIVRALHEARYAPSSEVTLIGRPEAELERFETYLLSGTVPWRGASEAFDPTDALRALIAAQPTALAVMLRRIGARRHALERLVTQAGAALPALLAVLMPADAAAILTLIGDIVAVHRDDPEPPLDTLSEPALERMLWTTTLEFLLRDAGSDFNRRRFLDFLLGREAERLGVDYAALLQMLAEAAESVSARQGLRSSLPKLLIDLMGELPASSVEPVSVEAEAREQAAIGEMQAGRPGALLAALREYAAIGGGRFEALLQQLGRSELMALVRSVAGEDATTVGTFVEMLASLPRDGASRGSSDTKRTRLLRAALAYLLGHRSAFDRTRFFRHLLLAEASRAGTSYATLLDDLMRASAGGGDSAGVTATLSALLTRDVETLPGDVAPDVTSASLLVTARERVGDRLAFAEWINGLDDAALKALLRQTGAIHASADIARLMALHRDLPSALLSERGMRRLARGAVLAAAIETQGRDSDRQRYWRRVIARFAVETGMPSAIVRERLAGALIRSAGVPDNALRQALRGESVELSKRTVNLPAPDRARFTEALKDARPEEVRATLAQIAATPASLLLLGAALSAQARAQHIRALDPVHSDAVAAQIAALARLQATAPLIAIGRDRFAHLLWALAVTFLLRSNGARFDATALARHLIAGLARYEGVSKGRVAARLDKALREVPGLAAASPATAVLTKVGREAGVADPRPTTGQRHLRIAHYLRTGQPIEAGAGLPGLVADDPAWLAVELRRLARATPAMIPLLLDRLRAWLLPAELLEMFLPGNPVRAARLADALETDAGAAWPHTFSRLLRGERPALPRRHTSIGQQFDETALIAHWLEHGSAPWWADDRAPPKAALAKLVALSRADLEELLASRSGASEVLERLRRLVGWLDADAVSTLLARIAPWAVGSDSALRALLAPLGARRRFETLLRAAATALEGGGLDLAALKTPLPDLPRRPAPLGAMSASEVEAPSIDRLFAWLRGAPASVGESAALTRLFTRLLDARDKRLIAFLAHARRDAQARSRWAALLPEEALGRLVHAILPARDAHALLEAKRVLASAWRRAAPFGAAGIDAAAWWTMLLDLAAEPRDLADALERMIARISANHAEHVVALRNQALQLASSGGHHSVAAALRRPEARRIVPIRDAPPQRPVTKPSRVAKEEPAEAPREVTPIYIANAGLTLLTPYLPALFDRLGVLTRDDEEVPRIVGIEDASRAVHLLQYLIDLRLDRPEPDLALNKLLCGLPVEHPVLPCIEPMPEDLAICDGLLGAVIGNWPIIAGTSLDGLRETFLQREGRLRRDDSGWSLVVQRKGVDVLVDQIPWGFSIIYHRWMPEPIQVTW